MSRKGFDSGYGGYPSPILPDNRLISLPIPIPEDSNCYSDLKLDGPRIEGLESEINTYYDLMRELNTEIKIPSQNKTKTSELTKETKCHLDPDIRKKVLARKDGWTGCFGQVNSAQTHLEKRINKGDLFLFFGWFRKTEIGDGKLRFKKNAPNLHII